MFTKAASLRASYADPVDAERFADMLYELGHDLFRKKIYEHAVSWLRRAHDVLNEQDLENLSFHADRLRVSVAEKLVKALIGLETEDADSQARDLINLLGSQGESKMVVSLLRIELLARDAEYDAVEYHDELRQIIRNTHTTDSNIKAIMHHVHRLRQRDSDLACKALDQLLWDRLLEGDNDLWTERVVITRVWITTTASTIEDPLRSLRDFLEAVHTNQARMTVLGASATHAAHILIWKRVDMNYGQQQYQSAENWCRLALHPLFAANAGSLNIAKIQRKILLCALQRQDIAIAREIYLNMSEGGKAELTTKYLLYKVALRSDDEDLGVLDQDQKFF